MLLKHGGMRLGCEKVQAKRIKGAGCGRGSGRGLNNLSGSQHLKCSSIDIDEIKREDNLQMDSDAPHFLPLPTPSPTLTPIHPSLPFAAAQTPPTSQYCRTYPIEKSDLFCLPPQHSSVEYAELSPPLSAFHFGVVYPLFASTVAAYQQLPYNKSQSEIFCVCRLPSKVHNPPNLSSSFFLIYIIAMESQAETDLTPSCSDLAQFLADTTLTFEQLLSTPRIDSLIRSDIETFVHYCQERKAFATKFIRWGILGPQEPNNTEQTLNMVYICNSILTSEHEALSGLFIQTYREGKPYSSEDEENDTRSSKQRAVIAADYVYLGYLLGLIEEAMQEESYLDYLAKVLRTIASVKLPFLLAYLSDQIELYHKIVRLAHFPSVANLLAQILTGQSRLPLKAARMREMMIPCLLTHIHQNLAKQQIYLAYECFDEVISTLGRSEDADEDTLKQMCNSIVCQSQLMFYLAKIEERLERGEKTEIELIELKNCVEFLMLVIRKMRQDERKDSESSSVIFKPTLDYQTGQLYTSFFKLLNSFSNLYYFQNIRDISYKLVPMRYLQLLLSMSKHSIFAQSYQKYSRREKEQGISQLILFILNRQTKGIILQTAVNLIQSILLQEERLTTCNQTIDQSIQPEVLLSLFDRQKDQVVERVHRLVSSPPIHSNIRENEVQIRKTMIIINNYLEKYSQKWSNQTPEQLTQIIPAFNFQTYQQYVHRLTVQDHPLGNKIKPINQFHFIFRNKSIEQTIVQKQPPKQLKTVVFQLENKIKTHKLKIKEKISKNIENVFKQQTTETESTNSQIQMSLHQDQALNKQTNGFNIELVQPTNPEACTYLPIY